MKRIIPSLVIVAMALVSFAADAPTTKPTAKKYPTTAPANIVIPLPDDVIPNPEIEALVKSLPANLLPPDKETGDERAARMKRIKAWARTNMKEKNVRVEAVVIKGQRQAGFRIAGMENSIITFVGGFPQKTGERAIIEGKLRNLFVRNENGVTHYQFTMDDQKVSNPPATQPAAQGD